MPFRSFPRAPRPAVVLLCAAGLTAAACQSSTPTTAPVAATGTVAPAPPGTSAPAGSPVAAAPLNCQDAGLRVDTSELGGAMGRQYHEVRLTNTGPASCWVEAFPDVTLLDGSGTMISQAQRRDVPWTRVTVAPGGAAHLVLKNSSGVVNTDGCTARPSSEKLRVLRAQFFDREVPFTTMVCLGAADQFTITPWAAGPAATEDEASF
jgi:hypothetical protein